MQGLSSAGAFAAAIALAAIVLLLVPLGETVAPAVQAIDLAVAAVAGVAAATCLGIAGGARHRRRRAR
ncbi:hypothetical protein [Leifsonia virtsii]|jgi:hypothetical protein|uniref:Uncharacterized protein n=1 Tax=Leifsonia virtsii TaxID=3035915 RepID=A0ABT8J0Y1_9MICO|nr:hypothetical protein [Leifsonia virtsii]MDN4598627.1 hypothetical protein [Leifsonia virtsii]